jgi:hypothetical protein
MKQQTTLNELTTNLHPKNIKGLKKLLKLRTFNIATLCKTEKKITETTNHRNQNRKPQ